MNRTAEAVPTDEELVVRSRGGDLEAFDHLVLRYRKEIYRIAYRITGDHAEADDLAQETFCRAHASLRTYRGDCSLRTWLCRIVSNLSLNVVRSSRVTRRDPEAPEAHAERGRGATRPVGLDRILDRERNARLRRAIASLPPRQRMTLVLRIFQEMPYKEIAQIMECSPGTAKANFFHAVSALRRTLASE